VVSTRRDEGMPEQVLADPGGTVMHGWISMRIRDIVYKFGVAHGHTEPIGALDRLDGHTDGDTEDFAADSRAEVTTPKSGTR
jgi:hypothetical protein